MPHSCVIITIMAAAALILLPIGQSAPQQNNAELNELINRMANSPQLDRNAFRMSFGKRANGQPQQQKLQQKWPMMDGNSFRMSFGKRSAAAAGGQHEEMGEGQADQILTVIFGLGRAHNLANVILCYSACQHSHSVALRFG
jgi:hypothetical protein